MIPEWLLWGLLLLALVAALSVVIPVFFGAPWHPASPERIREGLAWCDPKADEVLVDLGSGDGRVLQVGAREFQLKGRGWEIDPLKVWWSRWRVNRAGLGSRIDIMRGNALQASLKEADIVFIYLTHQALDKLLPKLQRELKPSARVLCYRFCFRGVQPKRVSADKTLFLYQLGRGTRIETFS